MKLASMAAMAAAVFAATPAHAENELPVGRFGLVGSLRQNTGRLGDSFGLGWLWGVEAGYQPSGIGRTYSLGVSWAVLFGTFGSDDPEIVESALSTVEMNFGLRFRRVLGDEIPQFLVVTGGVSLLRTNIPIPPDQDRLYFGPYAGMGLDKYFAAQYLLSIEARYGLLTGGPRGLSIMMSFTFGSK